MTTTTRRNPHNRKIPSTPASRRVVDDDAADTRQRGGVGGAEPGALAAAAKGDGATFVKSSPRARAHVRQPPPSTTTTPPALRFKNEETDAAVVYGRPADAIVSNGASGLVKLPAVYVVVDVEHDLITSHDVTTWAANPLHVGQERDYGRDVGERLKVQTIAARLVPEFMINNNPDALNGPPVVDVAGIVLGGNGRTMALRLAYADGRAASYRALLVERCAIFGVERAALDGIERPVLVRLVDVTGHDHADLSRRLNEGQTQEKRAAVDAASLARRLSPASLAILGRDNDAETTLRAFLSSPASRAFVASVVSDGIIERRNATKYLTADGAGLTDDGKTLIERTLVAWAIPDVPTVEALGEHRRDLIARVVPALAAAEKSGHDLVGVVREAAEQTREADARGSTPAALASQGGLFGARELRASVVGLASLLHANRRRFVDVVRAAGLAAVDNPAGQGDIFGGGVDVDGIIARASQAVAA